MMKHFTRVAQFSIALSVLACTGLTGFSQTQADTLAIQDFEVAPLAPVWNFTGPVIYNSGVSAPNAAPPNSPIGIGGSRAWETTTNSGGLVLEFDNIVLPQQYDTVKAEFRLAAMSLTSPSGGPDNLDYVLAAYSTDGGNTWINRLRIRGASNDNSFWDYGATQSAVVNYLPASETMFQPTNTGYVPNEGYSFCQIVFPTSGITQIKFRITARSSSSTDTWLIDHVALTGVTSCQQSTSQISALSCGAYTAPSGNVFTTSGTYLDTIPNQAGCDSIITIDLNIGTSTSTINVTSCTNYTAPSGTVFTTSGTYLDTIPNQAGCDSIITINLSIPGPTTSAITVTSCTNYTAPSGTVFTSSGTYLDTIPNQAGCDSIITINLTIPQFDITTTTSGPVIQANETNATYQWIDCGNGNSPLAGETSLTFIATAPGSYAVILSAGGCSDTSDCVNITQIPNSTENHSIQIQLAPNPAQNYLLITSTEDWKNATLTVWDIQGKITYQVNNIQGSFYNLPVEFLSEGIYILDLKDVDFEIRQSFIKN